MLVHAAAGGTRPRNSGSTSVSTVFGRVEVPNPRWNRCGCQTEGPQTFRPMRTWLNGQTSPEMLYLETKWASLIPFARATDLLKEVLPVGDSLNAETVRKHLQLTAERHLLLQTRTKVLNEDLDDLFRRLVSEIQAATTNERA